MASHRHDKECESHGNGRLKSESIPCLHGFTSHRVCFLRGPPPCVLWCASIFRDLCQALDGDSCTIYISNVYVPFVSLNCLLNAKVCYASCKFEICMSHAVTELPI